MKLLKSMQAALLAGIALSLAPHPAARAAALAAAPSQAALPRIKPPAPAPAYISEADKQRVLAISSALKARDFSTAQSLTGLVADPIAKALGQWMYFMAQDPNVDFNDADAFLDANPDWPARARIHAFVEDKIPTGAPADQVLAFFDTRTPVTGMGKIQLARALFAVGDKLGGERFLRDAWINDNFSIAEERRIVSSYGGRLGKDDHAARVDRLLWDRQVTNARRVFSHLNGGERRKAEARAALLLSAASGEKLYNRLAQDEQLDSGMLHAAVRYYRRKGQEQYAMSLAEKAPTNAAQLRNPERWWGERQLLMRWAIKQGRFADAYTVAAAHGMDEGGDFAEAEFYAGWIALRFLNAPERAQTHFLALASGVGSPISISRAYYWLGRAAAANGDSAQSNAYMAKAAENYYSYYGQLAAEDAGAPLSSVKFSASPPASHDDLALFSSRPTVAALRMLTDLNLDYEFMVFAYHVDDQLERPGEYREFAKLTDGEGAPHLTVRAGKVAVQRGAFAPEIAYPLVFVPEEAARFVSPEIILGLSRQESEFNPRAYSRAGARGVMQLIPTTAQITARKEGLVYSRNALLDDPIYNMTLGSAHLSHLLERFDGSLIMTLAAYNAGAGRVDRWILEYGDPRSADVDPLDWVELIPFEETRNYVQRVMENVQIYRARLGDQPIPGQLHADLERGGAQGRVAALKPPSIVLAKAAAPFGAQALPPLPERTAERARRFAQNDAAQKQAPPAVAAPITFEPAKPVNERSKPRAVENKSEKNSKRRNQSRNARSNTPPAKPTSAKPDAKAPPAIASSPPPADPATVNDASRATAPKSDLEKEMNDLLSMPVIAEAAGDEVNDFSVNDSAIAAGGQESEEMDGCLTYRDFLARNAEEETQASDLNAGMLAELRSGGADC